MKKKLSTQLSFGFAAIVLVTVALIALVSNLLISRQFEKYVEQQQREYAQGLADSISRQFDMGNNRWNSDYIHGFGMYALNEGYIIRLYDANGQEVWDALNHDMALCHQVMDEISIRMKREMPRQNGNFVEKNYVLEKEGQTVGYAEISCYSPYSFNDNAFHFVNALNRILFVTGILSVFGAIIAGVLFAGHIAGPLGKITEIAGEISEGNFDIRYKGKARTKEICDLTQSVNHMACSLEEQETLRKRLTADVAHELRTPLANVSACLEAILEGVWEPEADRLRFCYEELGRLSELVSDMEELRQVESEKFSLQRESVDLFEMAKAVKQSFEAELEKRNVNCKVEGESAVLTGDPKRLRQVVCNLLSNAVNYSEEGGTIQIEVRDKRDAVSLSVKDDGMGIPQKDQPFIFERFYRTDRSRQRKTGGAGIGLTIVKAITEAHGGQVRAESREGEGSTFIVTLPVCPQSQTR